MTTTATDTRVETREIGRTGIRAPAVGLGTWAIGGWMWGGTDEAASIAAIGSPAESKASVVSGVKTLATAGVSRAAAGTTQGRAAAAARATRRVMATG